MANYQVEFSKSVEKDLEKLSTNLVKRMWVKIDLLGINQFPSGVKRLIGTSFYRLRIGDYRMIYEVDNKEEIITILNIKHRKEVYRDL